MNTSGVSDIVSFYSTLGNQHQNLRKNSTQTIPNLELKKEIPEGNIHIFQI